MFILGLVLALIGWFVVHSTILFIIGIVLLVLGLGGNGYAHFGAADGRRRYWF